ncbi:luciferase-like protein [Coleophoma crateriformis]|uniref:Luciferase-like protein n=1 Tax=Coleophoma crateriformis TaxID=565419 RepID=A0A3D8QEZ2_9HELO|nr:luciferase-like protein [Coleophoma crateriformis]
MAPKKRIHLNFFETAFTIPHRNQREAYLFNPRDAKDNSRVKDRLNYYIWLAKLAEKGKITSIFFADTYAGHETYGNDMAATFRGGSQVAQMDPVVFISAMAAVTQSVAFGVTGSTSYITPYILARTWSTLDHVTDGRIAWNVVTSYSNSAAKAMGKESVMSHDERYAAAHEYMDLVYQMWESSWEDGAQVWDAENGTAYEPSKIHKIEFSGKYHKMSGRHQTHPSPQRTPVIFQAGASKSGIEFAGKHAEALYCGSLLPPSTAAYVKAVRAEAVKNGRDPQSIKFFAGISPIIGRTVEEAQAKYEACRKNIDFIGGLAKFSGHANIDMSQYPLDEPFEFKGGPQDNTIQGIVNNFKAGYLDDIPWTPRRLGEKIAFGGLYPMPVGTASMVADVFEKWVEEADIDGFNMAYVSNPDSYETAVELLVPELQRRGLMWEDYEAPGGTFRENLYGQKGEPYLPDHHPGSAFKWNATKKQKPKENQEDAKT